MKDNKKKGAGLVAVSGGFDPIHIGHVRLFKEARKLGKKLVVILNNDNWLLNKKGFVFMPQDERKEIMLESGLVDKVVITGHKRNDLDTSVNRELTALQPEIFANGGDRKPDGVPVPEVELCKKLGIKMLYNVGRGGKVQSSSWLTNKVAKGGVLDQRPWGYEHIYKKEPRYWIKSLTVSPGHRMSLQSHKHRSEHWVCVEGEVFAEVNGKKTTLHVGETVTFPENTKHRMGSTTGGTVVEVAYGDNVVEEDFIRYEDDYRREREGK